MPVMLPSHPARHPARPFASDTQPTPDQPQDITAASQRGGEPPANPHASPTQATYHLFPILFPLLNAAGAPLERYRYSPYGQRSVMNPTTFATTGSTSAYAQNRGFQGLLHDQETGLIENRARILDPLTGRFLQRDPLGYPDGMNAYAGYHVMWGGVDPMGEKIQERKSGDTCYLHIYKTVYFFWYPFTGEKYVATVSYPCDDICEEAIAKEMARKINISADLGTLVDVLGDAATASEIGIRLANEPLDLILTSGEFLDDPSLMSAMTLLPGVPGGARKIVAKNGTEITGYTKHGVNRAIGDGASRAGTKPEAIVDALKNPKRIKEGTDPKTGKPYQVFEGEKARVVVNPDTGQIVSVNPTSGEGVR